MKHRLRWTEREIKERSPDKYVGWVVACIVLAKALEKGSETIYVRKTLPTRLEVLYRTGGALASELTPPAKLHGPLVGQLMTFCGPMDVGPDAHGEFEVIRDDGELLVASAVVGVNEWGLTATIRFMKPRPPAPVVFLS